MIHLSKPQKSIYNMEKFTGGSIAVICSSIIHKGTIDIDKLKTAVNTLYRINDALRIRIVETADGTKQIVSAYSKQDFETLIFACEDEFLQFAEDYAKQSMDIHGSLCDVKIVFTENKYGLLVKLHHIIGDAWTMSLLARQFSTILLGNIPETFSYIDYIRSEMEYVRSSRYGKDKNFFIGQFKKCDEVTYLSDKQTSEYIAACKTIKLTAEQTMKIKAMAQNNGSSIFVVFMTLFAVYFSRIKMNVEKFYIGTPILNRAGIKEQNTAGMFINTVPFLAELNNAKTFCENLQVSTENIMLLLRHQHYNYEDLMSEIRKEYNFTEKLYDVILSYQNAKTEAKGFQSKWYNCGMQTESLQIHIDDRDNEGVLTINYDYCTDIFTGIEVEYMHKHIFNLFADAVKNPDKKIYELDILSGAEKNILIYEFNNTKKDYPKFKCVHRLFEEQAVKIPDKIAVIACDRTLSYDELNKLSNRVANALIKKGIRKGEIVAFALQRTSYLISVMFGILKSGAAYMPIDPDYPQDRIDYMLSDSNARAFITDDNINIYISDNEQNPNLKVSSDSYCYCIYTSGSTGKPKGTLLHHKGIINLVSNLNLYKDISKCQVFGFLTTITFDVATQEILTALLNGFTGFLLPERAKSSVEEISDKIVENKIDIIYSTPSYFDVLTSTVENTRKLLGQLKVVSLAGEKFYLNSIVKKLRNDYKTVFENQYGPVELHVIATATTVTDEDFTSIGRVIANNFAYILDKYNNILPIGHIGELCIAGVGVGVGYLNRPELTAKRFIENPFGEGKLYKTGDLAYWREDGNIMFVGRNDFQVKIRGLRIELGEIECAICSIDEISQAVTVIYKDESGRQFICAFYTEKSLVDVADIKKTILSKLPKYMLPHIFTRLDEMPLTPNGKINRKALPTVNLYNSSNEIEYKEPKTSEEKILISKIKKILPIRKISVLDNFFDIGGDSLKAIELISKLESNGLSTTVKNIFDSENIKTLATKLKVIEKQDCDFKYEGDILATPAQMRVYTAQNMNVNSTVYNVPYVFKVNELNVDKLQVAVDKIVQRHEILRTCFQNKDGRIIQVINENTVCKLEHLCSNDISMFIRPFDLTCAPLLRIGYYENIVMLDMHHIITDGRSMTVFLNELNDLYMGRDLNNRVVQYKQFSVEKQDYTNCKNYWLSVYNDELPELEINTDFPRGQKHLINGSVIYDAIDINLHNKINNKCKNLSITPFVFYMSAFYILLSILSGNEDIVVGVPISGRKNKYLNTIGMFVNTIALRNKPIGSKKVFEFLREVKENSVKAITNQDYPFGELVKELKIDTRNKNPLFDIMFAYQSEKMIDVVFGDKQAKLLPIPITMSKYDFTFNIMPCEKKDIIIMAEYCTDLYLENTISRFIDAYKKILVEMLDETQLIYNISAISKEEEDKILFKFNDTKTDYPKEKCIHQQFEEQVVKTPDKTAVVACDTTLTYDELNKLSNRIANALIEKDIGNGDIVAFALPRRSYLIMLIFGILKSGSAYLPIDPDFPQDRIDYILSDSNAKLFITKNNIDEYIFDNEKNINIKMTSDNYCYCIYTSGTTGNPKGTLIRHRNIINFCTVTKKNNLQSSIFYKCKNVLAIGSITFDISIFEILLSLLLGKTVVLANEEQIHNVHQLAELIIDYDVDCIHITPSRLEMLLEDFEFKNSVTNIKVIMIGGEKLKPDLINKIYKCNKNIKIFNGYGPTETTLGVSFGEI